MHFSQVLLFVMTRNTSAMPDSIASEGEENGMVIENAMIPKSYSIAQRPSRIFLAHVLLSSRDDSAYFGVHARPPSTLLCGCHLMFRNGLSFISALSRESRLQCSAGNACADNA
jgi:hypothetical protein